MDDPEATNAIEPLVHVRGLTVEVPRRRLFEGLSFAVDRGRSLALVAPSGAGKTTLLNCIAGIAAPAIGEVLVGGRSVWAQSARARHDFRLSRVGMVFQFGELIPELSLAENVALPLRLLGAGHTKAMGLAREVLRRTGVAHVTDAHPTVVSGGELQRAAVARALVHRPQLILADEPTGALDGDNGRLITELVLGAGRELGAAVIFATHDPIVSSAADRVLDLRAVAASSSHHGGS